MAVALAAVMPVRAQEATPPSTPWAATPACALPPPADAAFGDGTGGAPPAVPLASPRASPAASGPTDPTLAIALAATAQALAACLSMGKVEPVTLLTSDAARGQLVAGGIPLTPAEYAALAPTLPPVAYRLLRLDDAAADGGGGATAAVTYTVANQVLTARWRFVVGPVEGAERWTLDATTPLPVAVPADAATLAVATRPGEFVLGAATVPGPTVALTITNDDTAEHEVLVLRLAAGIDVDALLTQPGPRLPEGVTFIGDLIVPPGTSATLLLTELAPGPYTIVDLLPDATGLPHLTSGETVTFTVE